MTRKTFFSLIIDTDLSFYKFTSISYIELFVLISSTIVLSPFSQLSSIYLGTWLVSFPQYSSSLLRLVMNYLNFSTIFPQLLTSSDTISPLPQYLDSCFPLFALFFIALYLTTSPPQCHGLVIFSQGNRGSHPLHPCCCFFFLTIAFF